VNTSKAIIWDLHIMANTHPPSELYAPAMEVGSMRTYFHPCRTKQYKFLEEMEFIILEAIIPKDNSTFLLLLIQ
jgi:hypothetical protein